MATNSNTHLLQIEAVDTLFFRDGKPFTMGENSTADGIFPPPMSAIYGALRTAYLAGTVGSFDVENDPTKNLLISNMMLVKERTNKYLTSQDSIECSIDTPTLLMPRPLDLVSRYDENGDNDKSDALIQKSMKVVVSSSFVKKIPHSEFVVGEADSGFLDTNCLNSYLAGNVENLFIETGTIKQEAKIGIALNKATKTVRESMLYRLKMHRLNDVVWDKENSETKAQKYSILVQTNLPIPSTFIRLGGEGRLAKTTEIADGSDIAKALENIKAPVIIKYFKLYLLTPAVFNNKFADANGQSLEGLLPEFESFDPQTQECCWHGVRLKLLSAFIGRPTLVGGFDLAQSKPKAMQKAVPAGSVYYFELLEPLNLVAIESLIAKLHNKSICADENMQKQGYGISFVGNLNLD